MRVFCVIKGSGAGGAGGAGGAVDAVCVIALMLLLLLLVRGRQIRYDLEELSAEVLDLFV